MRLKKIIAESGLTQKEVALDLGLSIQSLNQYINGRREPGIATLIALADYFHVSVDYLIGRDVPAEKPDTGKTVVSGSGQTFALDPEHPLFINVGGRLFEVALAEDRDGD